MKKAEIKFFCDVCGKTFKPKDGELSFDIITTYSRCRIIRVGTNDYLDICEECKEKFARVLEGRK